MNLKSLKRIIYIDDDIDLQYIVRLGLEIKGGFTVKNCDSGEQAAKEIKMFQPDLVLLDMVLPGMSGIQLLEKLRNFPEIPRVPVIFLTAKMNPNQLAEYRELGVIGVINKPLNPLNLVHQVREIWEGS